MKASSFISIVLAVLLILSILDMHSDCTAADRKHSDGFIGYASSKVLIFISKSTVPDMDMHAFGEGLTGSTEIDALNIRYNAMRVEQLFPGSKPKQLSVGSVDLSRWHRILFAKDVDVEKVVAEYQALQAVEIAERISICKTHYGTPNDPGYSSQWHLSKIQASAAWNIETGDEDVVVAILDTGIDYTHLDLGGLGAYSLSTTNGNMWINWNERNGQPGVDDDDPANGYVDDIVGWDFVHDPEREKCYQMIPPPLVIDYLDPDNDPLDDHLGHGTRCASVVSAITNNGTDLSGVAGGWGDGTHQATANGAKVMALRIGTICGTDMDFMAEAFYYAANNGARIASVSVASEYQQCLEDALLYYLLDPQVSRLIFVAAMNTNSAPTDYLPTLTGPMSEHIVTVAATKEDDWKWSGSSYGDVVDVSAPGANILMLERDNTTYTGSGTSYATPMTAAVAALVWSKHPEWEAYQVRDRIFDTAEEIPDPLFDQGKLGAGRINAYWAVEEPLDAEFSGTPTAGFTPLTVQFTDESIGNPQTWSWDFGDDSTSALQHPQHQYLNAGTYTVELTVTTPVEEDTEVKTDYITVCDPIAVVQLYSPVNGKTFDQPATVNFRWTSTQNADEYNFQLDTDSNFTPPLLVDAITENLNYIKSGLYEGTYYWRVCGMNVCGSGDWSETRHVVIEVGVQPSCPMLFSFDGLDYRKENTLLQACEKSGYTKVVTDYYQLNSPGFAGDNEIRFQLRELEDEITYLHKIELLTVDHSAHSKVACDVNGEITVYEQSVQPISAVDHNGVDRLHSIVDEDGSLFESGKPGYLIVSFPQVGPGGSGVILRGGGKLPCFGENNDGEDSEPTISQLAVEVMGDDGAWLKLADVPSREYPALEQVLHNTKSIGDLVTVRLSWNESYRTDVIALYVSKAETPSVRTWGISDSKIMQANPDGWQTLDFAPGNPLILRKGDVFEFSYKPELLEGEAKTRDYIIRAVGLYQPDHAVYSNLAPKAYRLYSNYPNPFNPATTISYDLPASTWVKLEIYDVSGRLVAVVVDQEQGEGHHTAIWKGTNMQNRAVESGIYFYRLTTQEFVESRKMLLMR